MKFDFFALFLKLSGCPSDYCYAGVAADNDYRRHPLQIYKA